MFEQFSPWWHKSIAGIVKADIWLNIYQAYVHM